MAVYQGEAELLDWMSEYRTRNSKVDLQSFSIDWFLRLFRKTLHICFERQGK